MSDLCLALAILLIVFLIPIARRWWNSREENRP